VVAVSKAGGLGVLGAVGFTPEQLETELDWIDEHIGDKPYGVDIVIPGKYEGMGATDADKLEEDLKAMIPQEHRDFVQKLLAEHNVPEIPEEEKMRSSSASAPPSPVRRPRSPSPTRSACSSPTPSAPRRPT
jgi:NAD(P)H-dependent flavin oxidoreductase YrpB (nitropropane dioxygenase family)